MSVLLEQAYQKMLTHFGKQNWWPGDSALEICVGAILTQNTNWGNVEKAIANLKQNNSLSFEALLSIPEEILSEHIRPSGYFRQKAKRLKGFVARVNEEFGDLSALRDLSSDRLREFLLSITGIGPETADSMVLYAFDRPSFVIDAYTKRILVRHQVMDEDADYYQLKDYFEAHLEEDVGLYNEYHALIVAVGKHYCKRSKPDCEHCPLNDFNGGPIFQSLTP
ncbi:MAG: endonuclease III domain-containing protein [Deltaproteobacteria bacterium]|nr:endonuclease III domain-containing protein [Deltaproteobacteria bacterium]